jgi:hypothetical protein
MQCSPISFETANFPRLGRITNLSLQRKLKQPGYTRKSMSEKILALIVQFVTHVIGAGGYAGIAGLITLNSCGVPIPSELIMPFSGYLVYLGRERLGATLARRLRIGLAPEVAGRWSSATANGC